MVWQTHQIMVRSNFVVQELDTGKFLVKKSRDTEVGHELNKEEFLYLQDYYQRQYEADVNDAAISIWRHYPNVVCLNANQQLHCTVGPAVVQRDGTEEWYLSGEQLPCSTAEEFQRCLKLKAFL